MTAFAETLKPAPEAAPEPVVSAAVESVSEPVPPTETKGVVEEKTEEKPKSKEEEGQLAAMIAERKKRQQAEAEREYFKGLAEGRAKQAESVKTGPTPEELENEYLLDPRGVTQKLIEERISNAIFEDRMARSLVAMRREVKDYDQLIEKYGHIVPDPIFEKQIRQHPEPARFVYETLKNQEKLASVNGDPAEYEKKIRAEIEAKVRKELALQEAGNTPTTPIGISASGSNTATSIPSLEGLFASRRNKKR